MIKKDWPSTTFQKAWYWPEEKMSNDPLSNCVMSCSPWSKDLKEWPEKYLIDKIMNTKSLRQKYKYPQK